MSINTNEPVNVSGVTIADLQERLRRMLAVNLSMQAKLQRQDAMLDNVEGWCCAELKRDDPEMAAVWQHRVKAVRECRMVTAVAAPAAVPSTNGAGGHS